MDRRFVKTYFAKLQEHREDMQKRKEERLLRMQMQAREQT